MASLSFFPCLLSVGERILMNCVSSVSLFCLPNLLTLFLLSRRHLVGVAALLDVVYFRFQ